MSKESSANLHVRLNGEMKKHWDQMLKSKKISMQIAGTQLVEWFLQQPDLLQSIILGQIRPDTQLQALDLIRDNLTKVKAKRASSG